MGCRVKHLGEVFSALRSLWSPLIREPGIASGPSAVGFVAQAALPPPFRVQWGYRD